MSKGKYFTGAVVVILALLYFTPYIAVRNMKAAADARDGERLAEYVDFPAVKECVRGYFTAQMMKEMTDPKMKDNPFAAAGIAMASAFVGPMVDAMVTPQGLSMMMKNGTPLNAPGNDPVPSSPQSIDQNVDTSMGYRGLNKFYVSLRRKGETGNAITFGLSRDGLFSWKVTTISLPEA